MGEVQRGFVGGRNGRFGFLEVHLVKGQAAPLNADVPQQVHEFGIQRLQGLLEVAQVVLLSHRKKCFSNRGRDRWVLPRCP